MSGALSLELGRTLGAAPAFAVSSAPPAALPASALDRGALCEHRLAAAGGVSYLLALADAAPPRRARGMPRGEVSSAALGREMRCTPRRMVSFFPWGQLVSRRASAGRGIEVHMTEDSGRKGATSWELRKAARASLRELRPGKRRLRGQLASVVVERQRLTTELTALREKLARNHCAGARP